MIKMLKLLIPFLCLAIVFSSCKDDSNSTQGMTALGGKKYGGTFKFMSSEKVSTLMPSQSISIFNTRITNQIFEPLMRYDSETMEVIPALAESFSVNDDLTKYTFKLREGAKFSSNDCFSNDNDRLVTAEDVKFSLSYATSGLKQNKAAYLLKDFIKGGEEYYENTSSTLDGQSLEGIQTNGSNEVIISLVKPFPGFEKVLANSILGIVSKKAYEKYGETSDLNPVGSGPFVLESFSDSGIKLKRNPDYWQEDDFGNKLPFLEGIEMTYSDNKRSQLDAFQTEEVDIVLEIPVEEVPFILGELDSAHLNVRHKVEAERTMGMTYICMAVGSDEFSNLKVRQAINLAIDRKFIIENDLKGEGYYAENGVVPSMTGYDNSKVKGDQFNPVLARQLLAQAGYPNGVNFPKLEIYVNGVEGGLNDMIGRSVSQQLKKHLNLEFSVKMCSLEERDNAIASGTAKIWRSGWVADYPGPHNFLSLYSGDNRFGYSNESFNKLFRSASAELDSEKRSKLFEQCDQMIVNDVPVIPIMRDDHIVLVNLRVRDFNTNPMQQIYLAKTFIKELKSRD